jgi:hypothetical protein
MDGETPTLGIKSSVYICEIFELKIFSQMAQIITDKALTYGWSNSTFRN